MGTNKERIEALEKDEEIPNDMQTMEAGITDKFLGLEELMSKLSEVIFTNIQHLSQIAIEQKISSSRVLINMRGNRVHEEEDKPMFSSKLTKLNFLGMIPPNGSHELNNSLSISKFQRISGFC